MFLGIWKDLIDSVVLFSKPRFKLAYRTYLLSREWSFAKDVLIGVKGKRCVSCGSEAKLQMHHKWYSGKKGKPFWKSWGTESTNQLMILCEKCHETIHENLSYLGIGKYELTYEKLMEFVQKYCKCCEMPIYDFSEDDQYLEAINSLENREFCSGHEHQLSKND